MNNRGNSRKYSKKDPSIHLLLENLLPSSSTFAEAAKKAVVISRSSKEVPSSVILSAGSWEYRGPIVNWMKHMKMLGITQYLILCFDMATFNLVGPDNGFLVNSDLQDQVNRFNSIVDINSKMKKLLQKTNARQDEAQYLQSVCRYCVKSFEIMMISKLIFVSQVLNQGVSVIWSDTDAVWLRPCALSFFASLPPRVDIVAQRGKSPLEVSSEVGFALCTGFFMARATLASQFVFDKAQLDARKRLFSGFHGKDDQNLVNDILIKYRAFQFDKSKLLRTFHFLFTNTKGFGIMLAMLPSGLFPREYHFDNSSTAVDSLHDHDEHLNHAVELPWNDSMNSVRGNPSWSLHEDKACIWHILSNKVGMEKIVSMHQDNVWKLSTSISFGELSNVALWSPNNTIQTLQRLQKELLVPISMATYPSNARYSRLVENNIAVDIGRIH